MDVTQRERRPVCEPMTGSLGNRLIHNGTHLAPLLAGLCPKARQPPGSLRQVSGGPEVHLRIATGNQGSNQLAAHCTA
jgi:hypothetical protein